MGDLNPNAQKNLASLKSERASNFASKISLSNGDAPLGFTIWFAIKAPTYIMNSLKYNRTSHCTVNAPLTKHFTHQCQSCVGRQA